jgi:hypothetical protein
MGEYLGVYGCTTCIIFCSSNLIVTLYAVLTDKMPPKMERPEGYSQFLLELAEIPFKNRSGRSAKYAAYAELVGRDKTSIISFAKTGMQIELDELLVRLF